MTDKGPAFVTGGSSGIGLEIARRLARRGHPVALFARGAERLSAARDALADEFPKTRIAAWAVDVGDREGCLGAMTDAIDRLGPPAWAVANAGIAEPGEFLDQPLDAHEAQMQANYFGALHLAHATAGPMAEAGGGKLIFVASGAAFFGIYGYAAYAPSKFAVRGLAEVLQVELAPKGIDVTLAYPPDTDTPQLAEESKTKPEITKKITGEAGVMQPGKVADAILKGADKGRFIVAPGLQMSALSRFHSLLAPALRRWQAGIVRKAGR